MKFPTEKLIELWHNKWLFGAIIAFFSAVLALILAQTPAFENFEFKTYDIRFKLRGVQDTEQDNIVIVAIDDQSFVDLDTKWPFPRVLLAKTILNLYKAGAKLIVVDIELTETGRQQMRQDTLLYGAIKVAQNVVLSGKLVTHFGKNDTKTTFILPPSKLFLQAGAKWGLVNVDEDADGFIRRYWLFHQQNDKLYFPLAAECYLNTRFGKDGLNAIHYDDDGRLIFADRHVPTDGNSMLINFRGPAKTFPTYSFSSVLDDENFDLPNAEADVDMFEIHKEEGTFKNKIVFVGATAEELQDNKFTPFFNYKGIQKKLPGVELHANALSTLMRGDFISPQNPWFSIFIVFVLAFASMLVTKLLKPFRGLFVILALVLVYVIISLYAFINHQVWIEITAPMTGILLSFVGNVLHQTLTEQRERIRIKKSWEQYMPKNVIEDMLESGKLPTYGGERRELTVLFSDIRSFTTFSEKHSSREVVEKLNEYLTSMVDVIFKNGGTLDKFVGDEIMALYGAPHAFKNHAEKACCTALEMIERLSELQKAWSAKKEDYFQIGIGVNSGKMILGNLGSQQLFDYTVIGDNVNLGARLEGTNKQYGSRIIISEYTYKSVKRKAKVRELDLVRVKGKKKPVKIYELRGMGALPSSIEQDLIIDVFAQALKYYKNYKWYQALTEFKRILAYFPTDGPTRVYIKRCLDFIENPPPENWDGVYEFTSK